MVGVAGMSFVMAAPEMVASAASELASIGSAVSAANAAAATATTRVLAAAADEVSESIAALFGSYAQEYQALSVHTVAFDDQFAQVLNAGARAYADVEAGNRSMLQSLPTAPHGAGVPGQAASSIGGPTALIMGPTGNPGPTFRYLRQVYNLYVRPFFPGSVPSGLTTPEQFQPFSGIPSLTFDQSVAQGAADLDAAIMAQHALGNNLGNKVVVLGFSQSASVATLELRHLASLPVDLRPTPDQLSFVLLGDPNNPNGGLLARFPGLYLQPLGLTFSGATPSNVYPTTVYTRQYDGFADFPQYPINVPADLNALLGIYYSHGTYQELTPAQVAAGVVQPVSPADVYSTYVFLPTEQLPLLQPLRGIVPAPLLDLVEPDLRVIVELGYDRSGYADVPTPAGLFPTHLDPVTVAGDLAGGTAQGINHALADVGLPALPQLPTLPTLPQLSAVPSLPELPTLPATVAVAPQLGGIVDGPLNCLNRLLDIAINDTFDPAMTSAIYQAGDALTATAISYGAAPQLINAISVGQQILPILVGGPGYFVTADVQYLVNGIEDLSAGNLTGFDQNMQLIPATDIMLSVFGVAMTAAAVGAIVTGQPFPT